MGRMSLQKRRRVTFEYTASDKGPDDTSAQNKKFSGFVRLFKKLFEKESEAEEWVEITLRKMLTRYGQLGMLGIPKDEEMEAHAKRVKKLTINDLQMINKPQAKVAARTLHKIKAKRVIVPLLRQATLSTSKYPPRILHMPISSTNKYSDYEMLHVNEADKRRLMAGRVTIQQISRRSWWTPCRVIEDSRTTIALPGTMHAVYVCFVCILYLCVCLCA